MRTLFYLYRTFLAGLSAVLLVTSVATFTSFVRATSKTIKKAALLLFSVAVLLAGGAGAVRGQSALDGFDPGANNLLAAFAVQADGKILVGGYFTTLGGGGTGNTTRNRIGQLNPDGSLNTNFNPGANNSVIALAVQTDGKILVGGDFTGLGGGTGTTVRNHLGRLNADGSVDTSFNPGANNRVNMLAVQTDGKILVAGDFTTLGGGTRNKIGRLNPDGSLDTSFNPGANATVRALAVQADGKILVAGDFTTLGGGGIGATTRNYIGRLNPNGSLDTSFNPGANSNVSSLALQADGKILVGGDFTTLGGGGTGTTTRNRIGRLNANGTLDTSFDPGANSSVFVVTVQTDGKILAGGNFTGLGGGTGTTVRNYIGRLNPNGSLDTSFNPGANAFVSLLALQADGKILLGGQFTTLGHGETGNRARIGRLETDGRLEQTLDLSISNDGFVLATAVQPDGKILIGGTFTEVSSSMRHNIARLDTEGEADSFGPDPNGGVYAIAVQADGKILLGGNFTRLAPNEVDVVTRNRIARVDGIAGLADSFDPNANGVVYAIAVQADGKILLGGNFTTLAPNGGAEVTRNRIARLNTDGTLDSAFNPNANGDVYSIVVQADGKILLGGIFTMLAPNGGAEVTRNRIARLNMNGTLDTAFNPNANGVVYAIAVQTDGKILLGGSFTTLAPNGGAEVTRNRIARLNTTGLVDSFNPNANGFVYAIAVQADGKILAGGQFTNIGGEMRNFIARLGATTGVADSFDPSADTDLYSMALQGDGKILAGGGFTTIGGQTRNFFARLSNDTAALQKLGVTPSTITWTRGGSSSQFTRVTFESSTDNVNYVLLGNGIPQSGSSNWTLTGLNLSTQQNIYIRARGYYRSGFQNGSESIAESVRNAFISSTPTPTPTPTPEPSPTSTPTATPSSLGNISTRLRVLNGDNALFGGMIAIGTGEKKVIIRAIGPTLTDLGLPGALQDPTLELFQGNALVGSNDDWRNSAQQAEIANSGFAPSKDAESAIIITLTPGQNYSAIVRGKNGATGIGVVEAYDLDPTATSKLGNISTRGFVDVDDNVMIAGLIVTPSNGASVKVLARALGPTLGDFGVPGFLADPTLDLVNASGTVLRSNDNWPSDQGLEIQAANLAPKFNQEAALIETLTPGQYTAIVRGSARTTGVGLVEIYNIP